MTDVTRPANNSVRLDSAQDELEGTITVFNPQKDSLACQWITSSVWVEVRDHV